MNDAVVGGGAGASSEWDVVVIGAGISGLYQLIKLRELGLKARVLESGGDVGGTWYWNRYPGARCDIPTTDYTYSWDRDLEHEWTWSEKYATQPEILRYAQFVATKHDMYRHITFNTRVKDAVWDEKSKTWTVSTDTGESITCRHYVMATGCLSVPKDPDVPGTGNFTGGVYVTGRWPHEKVDFTGRRVAVIGTGSSGIQSIPLIAEEASQVTVFQRTPNFSVPAFNGQVSEDRMAPLLADLAKFLQTKEGIDAIKTAFKFAASAAAAIAVVMGVLGAAVGAVIAVVVGTWYVLFVAPIQAVIEAIGALIDAFSGVGNSIGNLGSQAMAAGTSFVQGLIGGITSGAGALVAAVQGLASSALGAFKGVLGIASPSKVMAEMGGHTVDGFAQGVDASADKAQASMDAMVTPSSGKGGAAGKGGFSFVNCTFGEGMSEAVVRDLFAKVLGEMAAEGA